MLYTNKNNRIDMKRTLFALMLACVCATESFAQLKTRTHEEEGQYEVVYDMKRLGRTGQIRYTKVYKGYILLGQSTNLYETNMHSILLGASKESAIKTLSDLKELKNTIGDKPLIVDGVKAGTKIWKTWGCLCFETEGVSGYSAILCSFKYDKAIDAIEAFQE